MKELWKMKNVNWKIRIKNKNFWLTLVPALAVLVQAIVYPFIPDLDLSGATAWLVGIINAVFAVMAILGIVSDPTTQGVSDSDTAMKRKVPAMNKKQLDK